MIKELLDRARTALSARPHRDPWDAVEQLEQRVRGLLDDYREAIDADTIAKGSTMGWIFKAAVPHEVYREAMMALLREERIAGQREGAAEMAERANWTCICRCKAHGKIGCPLCLNVYGCPYHSEVDPKVLRPEMLEEPEALERAIAAEYAAIWRDFPDDPDEPDLHEWMRGPMVEALRRVVSVRAAQLKR